MRPAIKRATLPRIPSHVSSEKKRSLPMPPLRKDWMTGGRGNAFGSAQSASRLNSGARRTVSFRRMEQV
jgi:hypothetical protein